MFSPAGAGERNPEGDREVLKKVNKGWRERGGDERISIFLGRLAAGTGL
jgi:hypothetical protein